MVGLLCCRVALSVSLSRRSLFSDMRFFVVGLLATALVYSNVDSFRVCRCSPRCASGTLDPAAGVTTDNDDDDDDDDNAEPRGSHTQRVQA